MAVNGICHRRNIIFSYFLIYELDQSIILVCVDVGGGYVCKNMYVCISVSCIQVQLYLTLIFGRGIYIGFACFTILID
jgi:hypothetical protein